MNDYEERMRHETGRELVAKEGREEIKEETRREKEREEGVGLLKVIYWVFSLVLIPFCA